MYNQTANRNDLTQQYDCIIRVFDYSHLFLNCAAVATIVFQLSLQPIMLLILPIILSRILQNFYSLFLVYSTYYCVNDNDVHKLANKWV